MRVTKDWSWGDIPATGNGSADKDTMITVFEAIHPELDVPKKDDIADAWFMSLMAEKEI